MAGGRRFGRRSLIQACSHHLSRSMQGPLEQNLHHSAPDAGARPAAPTSLLHALSPARPSSGSGHRHLLRVSDEVRDHAVADERLRRLCVLELDEVRQKDRSIARGRLEGRQERLELRQRKQRQPFCRNDG